MTQNKIIEKIESLTQEDGFIYTYSAILIHDQFVNADEATEVNWMQRLNYNELALVGRLLIKHDIDTSKFPTEKSFKSQVERLYSLMSKLQAAYYKPLREILQGAINEHTISEQLHTKYSELVGSGDMMVESIFYGAPGAFYFQYLEYAEEKYHRDLEWIGNYLGFSFSSCLQIVSELKKIQEKKILDLNNIQDFEEKCRRSFSVFCFEEDELNNFEKQEVRKFISTFSVIPGQDIDEIPLPGFYNLLESKPIIIIKNNIFFLPIYFNLAKSIYENPFYWMLEDEDYQDISLQNRGKSAEDIAYDLLCKVFGNRNVFKGVKVVKQKGQFITDIDILAVLGNKAVIVQIKSKRLTTLSKKGDEQQLRSDFKQAIQEAYDQGLKSREEVLNKSSKLIDIEGNEIKLHESLDEAYLICITLDHYPAIPHQIDIYLEKDESDPYPIALSMFDLDVLTFYLYDPFDFLYYINQRVKLQEFFKTNSEQALLAFHLEHKLYKEEAVTHVYLDDSFAQSIGDNYPPLKGYFPTSKEVKKLSHGWFNPDFEKVLNDIKNSGHPNFTDAIFFLYDISGQGADTSFQLIRDTKSKSSKDGKSHDCRLSFEKGQKGISYYCLNTHSDKKQLDQAVLFHSIISKYRNKSDIWLGLGSHAVSSNLVDFFVFNKEPWCEDPELEKLVKDIPNSGFILDKSLKKIGRNDPCVCGSGKKYKKCCGR